MLIFNELRITPDGQYLIIDVSVSNAEYYSGISIQSIIIDTQDTYISSGPSNTPIYSYQVTEGSLTKVYTSCDCSPVLDSDRSYCLVADNRNIRLVLNKLDLNNVDLSNNMFFVYAVATGTPAPETPCGMDNSVVMKTAVNLYPTYCTTMQLLKELDCSCEIPRNLINVILRLKALEMCIKTGNYLQAIEYWKKYFMLNNSTNFNSTRCGCYN